MSELINISTMVDVLGALVGFIVGLYIYQLSDDGQRGDGGGMKTKKARDAEEHANGKAVFIIILLLLLVVAVATGGNP